MEQLSEAKAALMRQLHTEIAAKKSALDEEADMVLAAYHRAVQADQDKDKRLLRGHWCYLMGQINGLGTALNILRNS